MRRSKHTKLRTSSASKQRIRSPRSASASEKRRKKRGIASVDARISVLGALCACFVILLLLGKFSDVFYPREITVTDENGTVTTAVFLGKYKLTAYCSCAVCCGTWGADRPKDPNGNEIVFTASGAQAVAGVTVAADPSLPFGTELWIQGETYVVQDRGSAIQGKRLDLYFDSHEDALRFGVQYAAVYRMQN